ncbi:MULTISPECIES: response regulator transcription factor [Brevundimonas]|jgi:DNA-binding NarL/FixJ family response regulator|uniref:Response regulator transcription factor n=2 Tax=Brevundimonas TaxID=41275 RepID=A0ACD4VKV5_9CAUL|nr:MULTISPECIES: response regulator transcription factor [Brevundimonas]QSF54297.1 response regulator transcription factor [Brevundimonas fontaquae]WBT06153.1 response regulator transcription factor [Brevundimonas vesicularis]WOB78607.1 response regulator transcription factor [Brevundimonas nasdae]
MDRIVVADDHPLFRAALRSAVDKAAPGAEVVECASLAEARAAMVAGPVDLLLLDLKLSDSEGMAGLAAVRAEQPTVPVAVVSASEDAPVVRHALGLGAAGFIPKSSSLPQMVEAIAAILAGDSWAPDVPEADDDLAGRVASLTPSQLRILEGLKAGRLNKQIAFDLGVSEATIKAHLTSVFRKLGVHNRTQAVILAKSLDPA